MKIYGFLKNIVYYPVRLWIYRTTLPYKVWRIRHKKRIKVLFIIHSLGAWKSELLYRAMSEHPRFEPVIAVTKSSQEDDVLNICAFLDCNRTEYLILNETDSLKKRCKADIIFYQKPYDGTIPWKMEFRKNLYAVFCYANYAFHSIDSDWGYSPKLFDYCWQVYFENAMCVKGYERIKGNRIDNAYITGLPFMDELQIPKEAFNSPWKNQESEKLKIIWAPHHSIGDCWGTHQSTFLEYCNYMVMLAVKYADRIQFAFKPHPLLREKLNKLWGKDKTDAYFEFWSSSPNTQYVEGKYIDLFKYSDAMIHDCASFVIEYHYTRNPVMFLCREGDDTEEHLNEFALKAKQLHYRANRTEDIELFIENLLIGIDPLKESRSKFYDEYLKTDFMTSDRIIASILGKEAICK